MEKKLENLSLFGRAFCLGSIIVLFGCTILYYTSELYSVLATGYVGFLIFISIGFYLGHKYDAIEYNRDIDRYVSDDEANDAFIKRHKYRRVYDISTLGMIYSLCVCEIMEKVIPLGIGQKIVVFTLLGLMLASLIVRMKAMSKKEYYDNILKTYNKQDSEPEEVVEKSEDTKTQEET